MPRFSFVLILTVMIIVIVSGIDCDETYDGKYDNVDIDEILKSERLLTNYVNCLMDEGPCTEDGRELKETLPDAISTDCSKCTDKQKESSDKVMHFIIDHRPEDWERLEQKYDASGKYRKDYLNTKEHDDHQNTSESES
ncbi:unnamed protein product [Diamesa tonsa]